MKFSQEHKSIQKALIVAAKFGFIRKETFWNYLTSPNQSFKYVLWNRLMKSGYLKGFDRIGIAQNFYFLSKKGYFLMCDYGFNPVSRAHPLHFEHDEMVLNFAVSNESKGLIKSNWLSEKSIRELSLKEQVDLTGQVLQKYPDLIFELNVHGMNLRCALEVERTRKSKSRYDAFVLSYLRHNELKLILIFYKDEYTKRSILESCRRLGYPQAQRPFAFCRISVAVDQKQDFEITIDALKISFSQYVQNVRSLVESKAEKPPESNSGQNSVKSRIAA